MSDQKLAYFDLGPKVVDNKEKYRNEEKKQKLTYNLVTDPRVKRGHNFGVIYVTSSSIEENEPASKKKQQPQSNSIESVAVEKGKKQIEDSKEVAPPEGRKNFGICTEKVTSTVRPKPLTFEFGVQTDKLKSRPMTPLIWPEKTGIDEATQIEDGELFTFDVEVEPIVNILASKVLEISRMEVLQEEEISEMKRQQGEYAKIRARELEDIKKLEEQERRRFEEENARRSEKAMRINLTKIYQMKLCSRVFAKEYLSKLKVSSMSQLECRGVFKNTNLNEYHLKLLPFIQKNAEIFSSEDYVIVNKLDESFKTNYLDLNKSRHRQAIESERQKKEDAERRRVEENLRQKEERKRLREERKRLQHEREVEQMRKMIYEDIITPTPQFADDVNEIFDINGFYQKNFKCATAIGGYIGQFALIFSFIQNTISGDIVTEEKITKILELYLPKSQPFYILYRPEEIEMYKNIDVNLTAIEDIMKSDEAAFNEIKNMIILNHEANDEVILKLFQEVENVDALKTVPDMFNLVLRILFKFYHSSNDNNVVNKIKFIQKDPASDENFAAVCVLNPIVIQKPKPPEVIQPVTSVKKPPPGKKTAHPQQVQPTKITFEPYYSEKTLTIPTGTDKLKIISVNFQFERLLRTNIVECIGKLHKFEQEKEALLRDFDELYLPFANDFITKLAGDYKREKLVIDVGDPQAVGNGI